MFGNPFSNLYSSYYDPADYFYGGPYYARPSIAQRRALAQQQALEKERAQRRAESLQRAKYLPDEDDMDDDDWVYRDALERRRAFERRQQEEKIINQRREEQERLEKIAQEEEEQRRESLRQAHRQRQAQSRVQRPPSPTPSRSQSPSKHPAETPDSFERPTSPPAEPIQSKHTLEEQNEAATKIQTAFRIHSALATLKTLESQFDTLRNSFSFPTTIDFQGPQGIVSVAVPASLPAEAGDIDTPKLAYDQKNYTLHSYTESLNRLLIRLDGVESWGSAIVRKSRRRIVGRVEQEANRVEAYWKQSWAAYVASNTEQ
ncbi:hypothetical protein C0993_009947 [Termitomyces sp. T159_Od127]|nr:hypothetical protein C0993_009947 [Termitomyces sp. T159_Od127]